ncbi:MAG: Bax inhibitor-1/YccA family protein [Phototrophicaceae bacterium]
MNNFDFNNNNNAEGVFSQQKRKPLVDVDIQPLMRTVYAWMVLGLLTTAVISFFVSQSPVMVQQASQFMMPTILLQLGLVMGISWGFNKLNPVAAGLLFFLYAALNGVMFGVIFFAYIAVGEGMAIANAFLTTAGLFGTMTVIGYTTKTDLSKWGTFLMMGVIGLFIAMIVNMFLGSGIMDFVISVIGVLIFTALTAYDTQRIKEMAQQMAGNSDKNLASKLAIMGALKLYLDFINIFLFLLRLFGGGRD